MISGITTLQTTAIRMSTLGCPVVQNGPLAMWAQTALRSTAVSMPGVRPRRKMITHGKTTNGAKVATEQ